jgi:hypothetical protein
MKLSKEIFRDSNSYHKRVYNINGDLITDEYKADSGIRTKKVLYNDKKQITSIIEKSGEEGLLTLYVYTGESYRTLGYKSGTTTYNDYLSSKQLTSGKETEAHYIQEYKIEKGVVLSEHSHDPSDGSKSSVSYTYNNNGLKASETKVAEDGTVTKTDFNYEDTVLKFKLTNTNNQFAELVQYAHQHQGLLSEEHKSLKYNNNQYTSLFRKYYYNPKKELEKTEYYGTYDGTPVLYKREETIRKGNTVVKKYFEVENAETVVGHFSMAAMYEQFKKDGMDWAISMFDKKYFQQHPIQETMHTIEKLDEKGNIVEYIYMHPINKDEVMARVTYRNEYNDESLLEFVIAYRQNEDGKLEEMDIKKYYYH